MDSLPYMCRFQYEHAAGLITAHMDPLVAAYSKVRRMKHSHLLPDHGRVLLLARILPPGIALHTARRGLVTCAGKA